MLSLSTNGEMGDLAMKKPRKRTVKIASASFVALCVVTIVALLIKVDIELSQYVTTEEDWRRVYNIMVIAESGGDSSKIGDLNLKNKAYGILQIRDPYLGDALGWARTNPYDEHANVLLCWDAHFGGIKVTDLRGCNEKLPYAVYRCYMARYANERRMKRLPTYDDVIRAHNGGGPRIGREDWRRSTQPHMNRVRLKLLLGKA
jgi:hypothetical protein